MMHDPPSSLPHFKKLSVVEGTYLSAPVVGESETPGQYAKKFDKKLNLHLKSINDFFDKKLIFT